MAQIYDALRAPWLALFSPSGAAVVMVRSPLLAVIVSFALHSAILACGIVGIALWSETLKWTSIAVTSRSAGIIVQFDTIQQVWHKWHRDGLVGPAEQIFFTVCLAVPALACICAWTHLPSIHKAGSALRSFHRAFCSVAACIVILLFASLAVGALITLSKTVWWVGRTPAPLAPAGIPLGICVVLWTVGRAVRGVAQTDDGVSVTPRCESCGYDLTHVARDNRCPECGADARRSLTPNGCRPGCVWEQRGGLAGWLVTSVAVLFDPKRFYSRLKLRTPDAQPRIFAAWHFFWIAVGAGFWGYVLIMRAIRGGPSRSGELFVWPILFALAAVCLAWGVRRLAAGIAASWLLYTEGPNGVRWLARVIEYEIPYLWVFCVFNGLGITLSLAIPGLAGAMRFQRAFFWMPLGPALFIFGNIALGVLWLWRYRIAARAVRWSNF